MKIASIVGTRPQFIKLSQVSPEIRQVAEEVIIHTGQHYDHSMDVRFFKDLSIPHPDHYLGVGSGTHGYQTGKMLEKIEDVLIYDRPDKVLVYGDCNTTLAGALVAVKLGIPVGHIEAGCRTHMKTPEEINRRCVDHISDALFAISEGTARILASERVPGVISNVGSTTVDACLNFSKDAIHQMSLDEDYLVLTLHRAENVDTPGALHTILTAIYEIENQIVFPIHPRTRRALANHGILNTLSTRENITLTEPMGYIDFLALLKGAHAIISDSGSIQQEAMTLRKRCVRLLSGPLFPELRTYPGGVYATGGITEALARLDRVDDARLTEWVNPLGDGNASKRIAETMSRW